MEYKKQYIWGSKNPALKVAYYLYDRVAAVWQLPRTISKIFLVILPRMVTMFINFLTGIERELPVMDVWRMCGENL